ncbi:extracellular solute-binding protein, partial [Kribbia dieselivorans]|uniref:extracellular solute-binding protein n=1 Tax=Kribbia dieselivorans TaxID=331526 RepID=UPI0008399F1B
QVQFAAVEPWRVAFVTNHPGVTVNYEPIGSDHGAAQFIAGEVDLAALDTPLTGQQLRDARERCSSEVIQLPVHIAAVSIVYSAPGVTDLRLSPQTLAAIFNRQITRWNDPRIAADNPGLTLPQDRLRTVHRLDDAWQSQALSAYLTSVDPRAWPYPATLQWPITDGPLQRAAKGTEELLEVVADGKGRVGYATMDQTTPASGREVKVAALRSGARWVAPSAATAAAALDSAVRIVPKSTTNLAVSRPTPGQSGGSGAAPVYPVVSISYQVACAEQPTAEKAALVREWLTWATSSQAQRASAEATGSAPIGEQWRERAIAAIGQIHVAPSTTSSSSK